MSFSDRQIGAAVRERRKALAMTEDELSAALCLPTEALQRQEAGELHITLSQLRDLTQVLGVSIEYFFQGVIADLERVPAGIKVSDLQPPGEQSDGAFLLSFLLILHRLAGESKMRHAEYYLDLACEEVRRSIPKGCR
jgi:transcriptional regulator with XRE-family HTH domain